MLVVDAKSSSLYVKGSGRTCDLAPILKNSQKKTQQVLSNFAKQNTAKFLQSSNWILGDACWFGPRVSGFGTHGFTSVCNLQVALRPGLSLGHRRQIYVTSLHGLFS